MAFAVGGAYCIHLCTSHWRAQSRLLGGDGWSPCQVSARGALYARSPPAMAREKSTRRHPELRTAL